MELVRVQNRRKFAYRPTRPSEDAIKTRREWDVMWVSHLCGSGRYVGFVPGGVGEQRACFAGVSM